MKVFNKIAFAFSAMALLASCSDDNNYQPGEWDAPEGYQNIAFVGSGESVELDPSEPTSATITMIRKNTSSECTVPYEVTINTDDVFKVGSAHFSAGDSIANINVEFPDAQIGKEYKLQLTVSDKNYVSSYSKDVLFTYSVTRVKWNPAGFYYEDAAKTKKVEGWAMYTEDIISSYWSIDQLTYPVRLEERADTKNYFRLVNPYSENWPYASYADASKTYYLYIDATDPEYAFLTNGLTDLGVNINDAGTHEVLSFVDYYADGKGYDLSDPDQLAKFKKDYPDYGGTYKNGKITFPKQALLQAVGGDGYYYANSHGAFCVVVDPSKDPYVAKIEDDFEWEKVYDGEFSSAKLGVSKTTALYKGVCVTKTDDCDKRFAEEWGAVYCIESPYEQGANIYFTVKDNNILIPEGYEYQYTGMEALGEDVYAHVNISTSTFEDKKIVLNTTFTNEDGSVEYGTTDEILENISWTPTYLGIYTYNFFFANEDGSPYYDEGLVLSQCDQNENKWKISSVFNGVDFIFNFDPKTNEVTFEEQSTGYEYPGYGMVCVAPLVKGNPYVDAEAPSYFEDGVFNFGLVYAIPSAGVYFTNYVGYETFTVTDAYDASAPVMLRNVKKNLSVKKNFQLSNKK